MQTQPLSHDRTCDVRTELPVAMTDEELLLEYRLTGNQDLFAELVHRYERELFNYLRRYLGDPLAAEDAFQTTFLQVPAKCDQFEEGRKVRPWLYRIATNQAIDAIRRNSRHRVLSLDQPGDHQSDEVGALIEILRAGPHFGLFLQGQFCQQGIRVWCAPEIIQAEGDTPQRGRR